MSGFFGISSKTDCVSDLYYGIDYHSHLGTRYGGMAVATSQGFNKAIHSLDNAYFRSKFEPDLSELTGNRGIGVISDLEPQPIIVNSHLGRFAVVSVGKVCNVDKLEAVALKNKRHFSETGGTKINPTELIAMLITECDSFEAGIANVQDKVQGSCSMLVLTEKGLFAARDKLGRTPIVLGRNEHAYVAASESSAFPPLNFEVEYYLGPGEIIFMTPEGYEQRQKPGDRLQICSFLWVYFGYPPSFYEGINVDESRYRCGRALARNDVVDADFVSGIPDSGIGHAIGYSNERGIPFKRPYVKYTPTWPRSFMPQNQDIRDLVAKMKLISNINLIQGKRIIFCEDSIVRGTQLEDKIKVLFDLGALEVHMRVACPPLMFPCQFHNFSTSRSTMELASRKAIFELEGSESPELDQYQQDHSEKNQRMVEQIRKRIGATSLKYQKIADLVDAIGMPLDRLCTHCWDNSSYF
jgi:amidophosphoribosyltransferase